MSSFIIFFTFLVLSANFAKGLEIRLSLSPATLFLGASLPNHTKMFELVHLVTSMDDFADPKVRISIQIAELHIFVV